MPPETAASAGRLAEVPCAACGGLETAPLFSCRDPDGFVPEPFHLVSCVRCGLIFVNPRPDAQGLSRFYYREYYQKPPGFLSGLVAACMRVFQDYRAGKILGRKKPGRILDVGCGEGSFLAGCAAHGWEPWGVETSSAGAALARGKGLKVFDKPLDECGLPAAYFDVITLWQSIEHVMDPAGTLRETRRILKDDGLLFLAFPNSDSLEFKAFGPRWFHLDPPRHLYHFSPRTMGGLLRSCGFQALDADHFYWDYNIFGCYQSLLNLFSTEMNFLYRALKGVRMPLSPGLWAWNVFLIMATAPIFLPLSVFGALTSACIGRSGCIGFYSAKAGPGLSSPHG
ncbi:MAG: class I SAM-dependent methyltransferase [Elusimicrobia bacterium]|nr:class I SAM-dependent methyltransferase [Elusimicrobiota bacterium]